VFYGRANLHSATACLRHELDLGAFAAWQNDIFHNGGYRVGPKY